MVTFSGRRPAYLTLCCGCLGDPQGVKNEEGGQYEQLLLGGMRAGFP